MADQTNYDVMLDPIVLSAKEFASDSHRNHALKPDPVLGGQTRKYSGAHYEVHPFQVGELVARSIHNDPITVAVAILHDVVEDTHKTLGDIREFFGKLYGNEVAASIVQGVSEVSDVSVPSDGNRKVRKELDKLHSWNAQPQQQTVKLADTLSNIRSIVKNDPGFARKWVREKMEQCEGFTEGDPALFQQVQDVFKQFTDTGAVVIEDLDIV